MGFLSPPSAPTPPPPPPTPATQASNSVALAGANERAAAAAASGAMGFDKTNLSGSQGAPSPSTLGGAKTLSGQ